MANALNIITNNPFRTLGIPETSNKRLIQKRIDEFEVYNAIGKYPKSEIDFSWIGKINRNNESIDLAKESLGSKKNHFISSLFWFSSVNAVDNMAIEFLRDHKVEMAISLWEKSASTVIYEGIFSYAKFY